MPANTLPCRALPMIEFVLKIPTPGTSEFSVVMLYLRPSIGVLANLANLFTVLILDTYEVSFFNRELYFDLSSAVSGFSYSTLLFF